MDEWNPYAPGSLQFTAFGQGWSDGCRHKVRRQHDGASARVQFAYERGYRRTPWHRSPNGQLNWGRR